ncbi:hypothetical protein MMC25_007639 [Agyrium rufum]|nr:hypothetical protein [Agyrium rufum]
MAPSATSTPNTERPPPPKHSLPLIDISPFLTLPAQATSKNTPQDCTASLSRACRTHGFFYLTNHGVPAELTDRVIDLAREFFTKVPIEEKRAIRRRDVGDGVGDGARGYQVIGDNVTQGKRDWHEAIDWYRPMNEGEASFGKEADDGKDVRNGGISKQRMPPFELLRGVNLWPSKPAEFYNVYQVYVQKMFELGTAVLGAMGEALELEDPETFVKATRESFWVMRAIGYPPLPHKSSTNASNGIAHYGEDVDEGISCGEHSDYGCLTLLLADSTKGALQVRDWESGDWINADPIEGALVVNIGDMMQKWTGGRWKSTKHRVLHRGENFRVSVPFFLEPDWDVKVGNLFAEKDGNANGIDTELLYGEYLTAKVSGNFG